MKMCTSGSISGGSVRVLAGVMLFLSAGLTANATIYAVTTGNDSGAGSLRSAITAVNGQAFGSHSIAFLGTYTIQPATALPALTSPCSVAISGMGSIIDGRDLSGGDAGFVIQSSGHTISDFRIVNFPAYGITILGNSNHIRGCEIGILESKAGASEAPNAMGGIYITGTGNTIGGDDASDRNVISGNQEQGLVIDGNDNIIQGNYIGTNLAGTASVPNAEAGIVIPNHSGNQILDNVVSGNGFMGIYVNQGNETVITGNIIGMNAAGTAVIRNGNALPAQGHGVMIAGSDSCQIGGSSAGERNVISGNRAGGIYADTCAYTTIRGNYIGVAADGKTPAGNDKWGITALSSDHIDVGGAAAGEGNVIGCNGYAGVNLESASSPSIKGNYIGTDQTGTLQLANEERGIFLEGVIDGGMVGGTTAAEGNVIAYNYNHGLGLSGSHVANVYIGHNSIYSNQLNGIKLSLGANGEILPPAITSVAAGLLSVSGTAAANNYVEVYADAEDEGRQYIGTAQANASGNWTVSADLLEVSCLNLTATAVTSTGATSEFSAAYAMPQTGLTQAWVDFSYGGTESGTEAQPFNTLREGVAWVKFNGTVKVKPGATSATLRIPRPVRIEAPYGPVRFGDSSARMAPAKNGNDAVKTKTGRVSGAGEESGKGLAGPDVLFGSGGILRKQSRTATAEGVRDGRIYEPVLPLTLDGAENVTLMMDTDTLSLRLRSETALDPLGLWADIIAGVNSEPFASEWLPAGDDTDTRDLWLMLRPETAWQMGNRFVAAAGDQTPDTVPVRRAVRIVEAGPFEGRCGEPIAQPGEASSAVQVRPLDAEAEVAGLPGSAGGAYLIEPLEPYGDARWVWLPVPQGLAAASVRPFYFHPTGEDRGWYPAENVDGWLGPDGYRESQTDDGITWLGFAIRHGGIVQLAVPDK